VGAVVSKETRLAVVQAHEDRLGVGRRMHAANGFLGKGAAELQYGKASVLTIVRFFGLGNTSDVIGQSNQNADQKHPDNDRGHLLFPLLNRREGCSSRALRERGGWR
jgi:hypothetical protein